MFVYKTNGGEFYCKSDSNIINTYELRKGSENSFEKDKSFNMKKSKNEHFIGPKVRKIIRNPSPI